MGVIGYIRGWFCLFGLIGVYWGLEATDEAAERLADVVCDLLGFAFTLSGLRV